MRNLKSSDNDPLTFLEKVCNSKSKTQKDPDYQERLKVIAPKIQPYYANYKTSFNANQLRLMTGAGIVGKEAEDLDKLYRYRDPIMQMLKLELTTTKDNRKIGTCPNCTISEVNSFDHILPRTEFMEFVVHPKNLFPSCTICNGHKGKVWLKNGKHQFLNLYLDQLPDEQYLFVNIIMENGVPVSEFTLKNNGKIDTDLYDIIYSHYTKLHLPQRFKDNSDEVISSLEIDIAEYLGILKLDVIVKTQLEIANKRKLNDGQNYWKSILEIALLNSKDFMKQFNSV